MIKSKLFVSADVGERMSRIRQQLHFLQKSLNEILWDLAQPSEMIAGCFYEVYKTCSKPNCCCLRGRKHGPFPALFVSLRGQRKLKMVRREDMEVVKKKAAAYKRFKRGLKRIRQINVEVKDLLEEIRTYYLEEYE